MGRVDSIWVGADSGWPHRFEWFLNWASAGLGSLNWISMGSSGVNWAFVGLASLDRASRGALVLLLRVLLFSLLLVCSALVVCSLLLSLLANRRLLCATCRLLCAICRVRACRMSLVSCHASLASRAARCVLPTGAQHVSSPLCIFGRLLLLHLRRNCVPISTFLAENCGCERF